MSRQWEQEGRYELKYVLPTRWRPAILELLAPHTRPDPHSRPLDDGRRGYLVRSLYLDTTHLDDYNDRLAQAKVRNRLRVRSYGTPETRPPVFLENKRKCGRQVIKHRFRLCDAVRWLDCAHPRPWQELIQAAGPRPDYAASVFVQLVDGAGRQPVSLVQYEREVFVPKNDNVSAVRLTLDHKVCGCEVSSFRELFASATRELIPDSWMVLELKFSGSAPGWMHQVRRELGLAAVPVSKYGLSVARTVRSQHHHELRALTPHPLLAREHAA